MSRPLVSRLADKFVVNSDGCWIWTAYTAPNGYGRIGSGIPGVSPLLAHRAMYEQVVGPIPAGLELDHLCRVRSCVNPDHLEPVTRRENCIRGDAPRIIAAVNSGKTHCPQGHPYDAANTGYARNATHTARRCRTCAREATARRRARIRDAAA